MVNKEIFKKLLVDLQTRLGMYVPDKQFASLASFLDGYLICYEQSTGIRISDDFRTWMHKRYKKHFALHEAWFIFNEVAKKDSKLAMEKLFEHWHEFLDQA